MLVATHELDTDSGSDQVYNALDVCLTHEIFSELRKQAGAAAPAYAFELALQAPVLEMMLRGFLVNPSARELGIQTVKKNLERLDHIVQTLANAVWDKDLNPNSGMQLKDLFYNHLGIHPIATWVRGERKEPMDRNALEQIENYFQARPIVASVLAHRDEAKLLQILEKEVDPDWRMRTSYNIGGTKSARFSSSKSPTGTGDNMQNITEELRHIFVPDPGYVLCGIDAQQSDSRMIGYMCGLLFADWTYLDAAESSDLHTTVARMVWTNDLPWTGDMEKDRKIAEGPFHRHFTYRDACKRIGHGRNFLGKPETLSKATGAPKKLVIEFCEKYEEAFPAITKWQSWTAQQLQMHQQLTSIHGRKRDFFDRTNLDETIRKALAFLAAAATADNLNLGMWRVWKYMPEVQLLAQVHDAIYFQFRESEDRARIVRKAQQLLTTELIAPSGRRFSVPTEAKLGYNWGNANDKNPKGLKKFLAN